RDILPSVRFRRRMAVIAATAAFLAGAFVYMKVNPLELVRDFHYVMNLLAEMLPPNFELLWRKKSIFPSLGETISMAFLGTLGGAAVAMVLALLAARNTSPNPVVRVVVQTMLAAERCTPNLVVLLILLIAVGIGPFAATLSLLVGSVGM